MENLVDIVLFTFLAITALGVLLLRSLFASVMLFSAFSLLSAGLFVALDAVDVAFTEAAVGAGISTILALATLALTGARQEAGTHHKVAPLIVVIITGSVLIYASIDIPPVGDSQAPSHLHVAPRYLNQSMKEVGIPNVVTSVLASYRGYDTLGEVTVILTAGIGVLALLGGRRRKKERTKSGDKEE
ncbi:MAG: cation:proton antiporter [Acidiferrobacteraceae bacterium]|nr:cation:proton antiporter [Acidiferrobacteraceae bacterium]